MIYYKLEPWGDWRGDLRAGIIASTIANVNRGKRSKTFKPTDFMPKFGRAVAPEKQSVEEIKETMMQLVKATAKKKPGRG